MTTGQHPTPLAVLRACRLACRLDGGRLLVSPKELLDADSRDYVAAYRPQIVAELEAEDDAALDALFAGKPAKTKQPVLPAHNKLFAPKSPAPFTPEDGQP